MVKTKVTKKAKKYIVQFDCAGVWTRSVSFSGVYKTLENAKKVAKKNCLGILKYRVVAKE